MMMGNKTTKPPFHEEPITLVVPHHVGTTSTVSDALTEWQSFMASMSAIPLQGASEFETWMVNHRDVFLEISQRIHPLFRFTITSKRIYYLCWTHAINALKFPRRATEYSIVQFLHRKPLVHTVDLTSRQESRTTGLLLEIAKLSNLTKLNLGGSDYTTDEGVGSLTTLTQLKSFDLWYCDKITDDALDHVAKMRSLQHFDVGGSKAVSDVGIRKLHVLTTLTTLHIDNCPKLTDHAVKGMSVLTRLSELDFGGFHNLSDDGFGSLIGLSHLTSLVISRCSSYGMTKKSMDLIKTFTNLVRLDISDCKWVDDDVILHMDNLRKLTRLDISSCKRVTTQSFRGFSQLTQVRSLDVRHCPNLNFESLKELQGNVAAMTSLNIAACPLMDDKAIDLIIKCVNLVQFDLSDCTHVTEKGLKRIGVLTALTMLTMSKTQTTNDVILALTAITGLQHLNLPSCGSVGDEGLEHLSLFPDLKRLVLSRCPNITDKGLPAICRLASSLVSLNVGNCSVTNTGINVLSKLTKLNNLNLGGCDSLTESGIEKLLFGLENLVSVYLWSCPNISDTWADRMKAERSVDVFT